MTALFGCRFLDRHIPQMPPNSAPANFSVWFKRPVDSTGVSSSETWKRLYRNAILELDPVELPRRIAEARQAMLDRAQEIFHKSLDEEFQGLSAGLLTLRTLEEVIARKRPASCILSERPLHLDRLR